MKALAEAPFAGFANRCWLTFVAGLLKNVVFKFVDGH